MGPGVSGVTRALDTAAWHGAQQGPPGSYSWARPQTAESSKQRRGDAGQLQGVGPAGVAQVGAAARVFLAPEGIPRVLHTVRAAAFAGDGQETDGFWRGRGVEMLGRAGPWALTHLPWPSSRGLPRVLTPTETPESAWVDPKTMSPVRLGAWSHPCPHARASRPSAGTGDAVNEWI